MGRTEKDKRERTQRLRRLALQLVAQLPADVEDDEWDEVLAFARELVDGFLRDDR